MILYTVPTLTIVFMLVSALVAIGLPILIGLYLSKKRRLPWKLFFFGALIFLIFVLVFESIFNQLILNSTGVFGSFITSNTWALAIYGGLAAGVFEEVGRKIGFKVLVKQSDNPEDSLMVGAGHGGIEAIVLVGITMIVNSIMSVLYNKDALASLIGDPAALQLILDQMDALSQMPSSTFLLSGLERMIAIALHISLSVLVYRSVFESNHKKLLYFAIGIHALFDFLAVMLNSMIPAVWLEVVLLFAMVPVVWYALLNLKQMKQNKLQTLEPKVETQ